MIRPYIDISVPDLDRRARMSAVQRWATLQATKGKVRWGGR
ncbi:hypothetical protein HMPREF9621_00094 [Cutibacterium modestum HL037PA2]|uniref:Uncharacterized protein n=1 Tax=Cutibacterium modestum HL044PA1 TaxID=765109 RepID=A0ABP2K3Q3_9ACTN|nr:hypothetical protein HMPREF9621_00094 [Cutibacterium modestum HL037PA2]EFS91412.1 hypothetical protein HMPREF9607_02707 [Cutibacterium modestum HL044PA1]